MNRGNALQFEAMCHESRQWSMIQARKLDCGSSCVTEGGVRNLATSWGPGCHTSVRNASNRQADYKGKQFTEAFQAVRVSSSHVSISHQESLPRCTFSASPC